jgi:hypothetical protein
VQGLDEYRRATGPEHGRARSLALGVRMAFRRHGKLSRGRREGQSERRIRVTLQYRGNLRRLLMVGLCVTGCDTTGGPAVDVADALSPSRPHLSVEDWVGCFHLTYGPETPAQEVGWEWGAFFVLPGELRVEQRQIADNRGGSAGLTARSVRSESGRLVARVASDFWTVKAAGDSLHLFSESVFNSRDMRVSAMGDSLIGTIEVRTGDRLLYRRRVRGSKRDCYLGIPVPLGGGRDHRERP